MKNKLRISGKRLRAVLVPVLAIVGAAVICANFLCYKYEYNMNYAFGRGKIKITTSASSVNAGYYDKALTDGNAAIDEMSKFNEEVA